MSKTPFFPCSSVFVFMFLFFLLSFVFLVFFSPFFLFLGFSCVSFGFPFFEI